MKRAVFVVVLLASFTGAHEARAGYDRTFEAGSLIIPMDLAYQDRGLFQAYGLVFQLLSHGVTVYWVIDPDKIWHDAPCDTPGDECAWACAEEGSSDPCPYPTASPDFFASAVVVWSDDGRMSAGDVITSHGYRGGPFVIDAGDRDAALAVVDAWNDPAAWGEEPWADRSVFEVVTVHEATEAFTGHVRKEMVAAPTIAVFSDGNEQIATGYLRAAGIPQSNGREFPDARCGEDDCGPGTDNPDMLTVVSIMGDMGTCDAPNLDHRNGALFTAEGAPAYCQIMSMHWAVNDRETVECDGGRCPATAEDCAGERFTYHGHEVVAEVRQFLQHPTHFFAECQAVNAYENTVPNPDWPFLDDEDRGGHFLTTTGSPPDCPCADGDFECVEGGCDGGARDCCLPRDDKERGAGFLIADRPDSASLRVLHPEIPYNQLDGAFETVGGSEPAYNLSDYLGTAYLNDRDVTFITGPDGPGDQDVWMTGYIDGVCDIGDDEFNPVGECTFGKVSYLGGHRYDTDVPVSESPSSQGARLFLNALFEADCVTSAGQPDLRLSWAGETVLGVAALPHEETYSLFFANQGQGSALDARLIVTIPPTASVAEVEGDGDATDDEVAWPLGTLGRATGGPGDPPSGGSRWLALELNALGEHRLEASIEYRVGVTTLRTPSVELNITVGLDRDGDTVPDDIDPDPDDGTRCGDADGDTCDDCSINGAPTPDDDGPDADGDGLCDAGDPSNGDAGADGGAGDGGGEGCACRAAATRPAESPLRLLSLR